MGGRVRRGGISGADRRRAGAGICGSASGACQPDRLDRLQHLRAGSERGRRGNRLRACFQAAGKPDWLAVPVGGANAGPGWLLEPVRTARTGRGPGVLASGPGASLALQLDLGDPGDDTRFFAAALPDGVPALAAVASGRVVYRRGVRVRRGLAAYRRDQLVGASVQLEPRVVRSDRGALLDNCRPDQCRAAGQRGGAGGQVR